MKSASKVMYTIGKVINIIEIVCATLTLVLGVLCLVFAPEVAQKAVEMNYDKFNSVAEVNAMAITLIVLAVVTLVVSCIVLHFANKAQRQLGENGQNTTPHIIMVVIGVFGDVFYFLGGLFGLILANEIPKANQ